MGYFVDNVASRLVNLSGSKRMGSGGVIPFSQHDRTDFFFETEAKELPRRLIKKKRNCPVN
jgi:hypothetical protein